jgi:hypothetical protein
VRTDIAVNQDGVWVDSFFLFFMKHRLIGIDLATKDLIVFIVL